MNNNERSEMTAIFLLSLFVKKITIYQVVNKNPGWSVITDQLFNKKFFRTYYVRKIIFTTWSVIFTKWSVIIYHLVSFVRNTSEKLVVTNQDSMIQS